MSNFTKVNTNLLFALHVLLVFLLLFESGVQLPAALQVGGRMHPLLLHLPIGFLVLLGILPLMRREVDSTSFRKIYTLLLHLAALSAIVTTLAGFWLSQEEGYTSGTLQWHKWGGVGVSLLCYGLVLLDRHAPGRPAVHYGLLGITLVALIFTGHNGAVITHGETFLLEPIRGEQAVVTEKTPLFKAAVEPILERRCTGCHNERKAKGGLIMTSREALLAGGENGPIWVAGDPANSPLLQRLRLPLEHEDHMPPEGKPQLSDKEIELIHAWIDDGAELDKPMAQYTDGDSLKVLAAGILRKKQDRSKTPVYDFDFAPERVIQELNTPFRTVRPVAWNQPALQADIFVRAAYQPSFLEELVKVQRQLVALNLSNLPIKDEDLSTIAKFEHLEALNLNNTDVTSAGITALQGCSRLRSLSLSGTAVDDSFAAALESMGTVEEVFVWNTAISTNTLSELRKKLTHIDFHEGYMPDPNEVLQLSPPLLENESFVLDSEQPVLLKHSFPGVEIRYTTDGSTPDSLHSPLYEDGITLNGFTELKTKVFLDGWKSSETAGFTFFKKVHTPRKVELLYPPNPEYMGEGDSTLTDGRKGDAANFRNPTWLGFREHPMAALIYFGETPPTIERITLSYAQNMNSYIMPAAAVEIWAGKSPQQLKRIKKAAWPTPEAYEPNQVKGIDLAIPSGAYLYYKIIAYPIEKLPEWHPGKGDKAWLFVDELFFY